MVLAAGSAGEDLRLSDRLATGAVACATRVVTLQVVLDAGVGSVAETAIPHPDRGEINTN
jgi:hypothetical protein